MNQSKEHFVIKRFKSYLAEQTMDIRKELEDIVIGMGYPNIKNKSSFRFQVLTDENRINVLQKLEIAIKMKFPEAHWDENASESSVGAIVIGRYMVGVAPAKSQGKASAGLDNEHTLFNMIREINNQGPMDILFKSKESKDFLVKDVVSFRDAGRDTKGRKKADIVLITSTGVEVPISLKKDKAEMWESADSYWAKEAKRIVDEQVKKGNISLTDKGNVKYMTPNVAKKANSSEAKNVVFGEDIIKGKGCVIEKTFSGSYKIEDNVAIIEVTNIITSLSDLKGNNEVWFLIRNDSSRKGSKIYPGIRVLAVKKSRINKRVLQVR